MTSTVKVFTHVDYPLASNPMQESIAFFRRAFLPQMQFTLSGVIQSLSSSNLKKKSFFFSPLHPPHHPTAAVSAVCSLYRWRAQPATCSCFFPSLAPSAHIVNRSVFWTRENFICGQIGISGSFPPPRPPLAGRYLLREKLAGKSADILPTVTSQKMRLSQDVSITTMFS